MFKFWTMFPSTKIPRCCLFKYEVLCAYSLHATCRVRYSIYVLSGEFKHNNVNNLKRLVLISETKCMVLVGKSVFYCCVFDCCLCVLSLSVYFIVACVNVLYFIVDPMIRGSGKIMYSVLYSDNGLVPSIRLCHKAVKPAQLAETYKYLLRG